MKSLKHKLKSMKERLTTSLFLSLAGDLLLAGYVALVWAVIICLFLWLTLYSSSVILVSLFQLWTLVK